MSDEETLGERIQRLREEAGLTREELGSALDASFSMRLAEEDRRGFRSHELAAIADALGVTVNDLYGIPSDAELFAGSDSQCSHASIEAEKHAAGLPVVTLDEEGNVIKRWADGSVERVDTD